jgi:hypothetical protein
VLRLLVFVVELGVFFLQVPGVGQDDSAQIDSRLRCVNRTGKSFFHEPGNPAAVVQVRMSQDDGVNLGRGNRQRLPVAFAPFLLPLEEPAVHQNLDAVLAVVIERSIDEMLRASYGSRRA